MSNQARTMRVSGSVVDQPGGGGRPGHAVVGFDGSDAAHDAVAFAAGWARRTGAALDIVYVADSPWQWVADAGYAGACAEFWDEPSMLSAEVADAMLGSALVWSYLVATGDVATELERCAARLDADAIIIGRSRRRMFSIPRRLVRRSHRIVIVVP